MSVMRLGYVHTLVTDLPAALAHYRDTLGLSVTAQEPDRCYLKGWDEWDHHSVVLQEGGVGISRYGFKVESDADLDRYERRLEAHGLTVSRMAKGEHLAVGEGVRFVVPTGQLIELYADIEFVGKETGMLNPDPYPRNPRGAMAPRLDHCLVTGDDPAETERVFTECLDFHVSERIVTDLAEPQTLATWLFCGQTMHDIAVLKGPQGKMHHFAFALDDWNAVLRAGDVFAMDGVPVDAGPTRHGVSRGLTIYFFDPSGNRNEVFAGSYQTDPDFPTMTWTADQLGKAIFYIQRELNERFTTVFT